LQVWAYGTTYDRIDHALQNIQGMLCPRALRHPWGKKLAEQKELRKAYEEGPSYTYLALLWIEGEGVVGGLCLIPETAKLRCR
jgi:hypothetical protein